MPIKLKTTFPASSPKPRQRLKVQEHSVLHAPFLIARGLFRATTTELTQETNVFKLPIEQNNKAKQITLCGDFDVPQLLTAFDLRVFTAVLSATKHLTCFRINQDTPYREDKALYDALCLEGDFKSVAKYSCSAPALYAALNLQSNGSNLKKIIGALDKLAQTTVTLYKGPVKAPEIRQTFKLLGFSMEGSGRGKKMTIAINPLSSEFIKHIPDNQSHIRIPVDETQALAQFDEAHLLHFKLCCLINSPGTPQTAPMAEDALDIDVVDSLPLHDPIEAKLAARVKAKKKDAGRVLKVRTLYEYLFPADAAQAAVDRALAAANPHSQKLYSSDKIIEARIKMLNLAMNALERIGWTFSEEKPTPSCFPQSLEEQMDNLIFIKRPARQDDWSIDSVISQWDMDYPDLSQTLLPKLNPRKKTGVSK